MHFVLLALIGVATLTQVATSRLEGRIEDPSGAVVAGASITVENDKNGWRATGLSNLNGLYVFPSLAPGPYRVTVEAQGFRQTVLEGLMLDVAATITASLRLEIGSTAEILTVEAKETTIQTADAQGSREVALRDIEALAQLERNPIVLAIFQPGVQILGGNIGSSRVNGTRVGSNVVKIDGIDASDLPGLGLAFSGNFATSDSTAEFRVVTHSGKAEYGRNAGAHVEMTTRSGANRWSGNGYDHLRNTLLNANDFFNNATGVPRPAIIQNIFGGSLGGPLRHDRTFIFGNYEGRRTHQQVVRNRAVLTATARSGLFRWRPPGSADIQTFDIVRNDPRAKGIDPRVAEILRLLPDPNNVDIGDGLNTGGFRFNSPSDGRENQFTVRADHNLRSARLFFRFSRLWIDTIDTLNNAEAPFPGQPHGRLRMHGSHYSLGADWTLNSRTVNELRFGSQVIGPTSVRPARVSGPMLSANLWTNPVSTLFASSEPVALNELTDNLSLVRGHHLLKFGANWHFASLSQSTDNGIYANVFLGRNSGNVPPSAIGPPIGSVISTTDRILFENLYNDLLGRMAQVGQTFYSNLEQFQPAGSPRVRNYRVSEYGYFLQDDWKMNRNVTLNLGLRYEWNASPFEGDRLQGVVDRADQISMSSHIADLTVRRDARWYQNDSNNFAPRVSVAWDLRGDGKSALRAGYGIYYERLVGNVTTFVDGNTPGFSQTVQEFPNAAPGSDRRVSDGIPLPAQPAAPVLRQDVTRTSNLAVINPRLATGYIQQYSLTLQRELFRNTLVEAGLVGNRGVKLFMNVNPNQIRISGDFLQSFREIQAFRGNGTPVAAANTLVRLFGSPNSAIEAIGATIFDEGAVVAAADTIDRNFNSRYASAGLSDFYLRNFPQYNLVLWGTNDGRSYYDSLQVSLRRQSGSLKFVANYTWSKTLDLVSTQGADLTRPVDSFNLRLNRARSDLDRTHVFNGWFIYTVPIGKGRWKDNSWLGCLNSIAAGWDIGVLGLWESGSVFSVVSGRRTAGDILSYANYEGERNIGHVERRSDGVFWFSPEEIQRFWFPAAGEIGSSGRNGFRGPRHFNIDLSLVKRFRFTDRESLAFRAEFYNLFNNPNFRTPTSNLNMSASFGRISALASGGPGLPVGGTAGGPRIVQLVLRYEF